jgi:peptidoglycan/LPS O-acetylase OafA/YrhL
LISHENGFLNFPQYFGKMPLPSLHEASVFAVAIFFAVSGFIIIVTSQDENGTATVGIGKFVVRRLLRIVPFLWLCTISYNLLSWAGTGRLEWAAMMRTLAIWPLGELKPNVAWSLRHEALFYALFALTGLAAAGAKRRRLLLVAWVLSPLPAFAACYDLRMLPLRDGIASFDLFRLAIMGGENGANLQFGAGMAVGLWFLRARAAGRLPEVSPWVMTALFVITSAATIVWPIRPGIVRITVWTMMAALVLAAAVATSPGRRDAFDRCGMVLGNASFSLYLIHNTVMLIVLAVAMAMPVRPLGLIGLSAFLTMAIAISVVVCVAAHYWIEAPLIRAMQSLFSRRNPATNPTPARTGDQSGPRQI